MYPNITSSRMSLLVEMRHGMNKPFGSEWGRSHKMISSVENNGLGIANLVEDPVSRSSARPRPLLSIYIIHREV